MSSKESEPPLRLELRSSRQLALALLLMHGAAMAAILSLALPPGLILALAGSVIVSLYTTFNTHVLGRGRGAILSLLWAGDGEWSVISADGQESRARLLPASYVNPRLVILNLALQGKGRRAVVVLQDSLDRQTFRRLLVRLRLEGGKEKSENR